MKIVCMVYNNHGSISLCCCVVLVAQLCLTLCNPVDCNPPGSSVHGVLQARILELTEIACYALLQGIFSTQELNLALLCRVVFYQLSDVRIMEIKFTINILRLRHPETFPIGKLSSMKPFPSAKKIEDHCYSILLYNLVFSY